MTKDASLAGRVCPLDAALPDTPAPDLAAARNFIQQQFDADMAKLKRVIPQLIENGKLNLIDIAKNYEPGTNIPLSKFGFADAGSATLSFTKRDDGTVSYVKMDGLTIGADRFEEDVQFNQRGELTFDKVSRFAADHTYGSAIVDRAHPIVDPHMTEIQVSLDGDRTYIVDNHNTLHGIISLDPANRRSYIMLERGRGIDLIESTPGNPAVRAYYDFDDKAVCAKLLGK